MVCLTVVMCGVVEAASEQAVAKSLIASSKIKAGLCVHLGCGDGKLTLELARGGNFLVHGLSASQTDVDKARQYIQEQKSYGQVSVDKCDFSRLPYADNLANLVIVDDLRGLLKAGLSMKEVMRATCPNGVILLGDKRGPLSDSKVNAKLAEAGIKLKSLGGWRKAVKPRRPELDDWSQRGGNAGRTFVSKDATIGPVNGFRWIAGPYWSMGRSYKAGNAGIVTANGRLFAVTYNVPQSYNKTPFQWEQEYYVLGRDAYNGLLLWTRPIGPKTGTGDSDMAEKLAAVGDRVLTIIDKNVVALDAATGEIVTTFEKESVPTRILYEDGVLLLTHPTVLRVYDALSGQELWKKENTGIMGCVAGDGHVYCALGDHKKRRWTKVVSLSLKTGEQKWEVPTTPWLKGGYMKLAYYKDGIVVFRHGKRKGGVHVISAKDGKYMWSQPISRWTGLFAGGLIWGQKMQGLDPLTGEVKRTLKASEPGGGCCPNVATEKYFVGSRPVKTIDVETGKTVNFNARHPCFLGLVPANGLVYAAQQGCYRCAKTSIRGFVAVATDNPEHQASIMIQDAERLEQGPAYGKVSPGKESDPATEWPIYRHDPQRSCLTKNTVSANPKILWTVQADDQNRPFRAMDLDWSVHRLGGDRLTGPTIAEGKVFVSLVDSHSVVALDAATGKKLWSFTTGGRLDTPPTIHQGLCLFGSHDGWVYCLRTSDGQLVWRFNAGAKDKKVMTFGQLESVSPVIGGVLVEKGIAYFASGRSKGTEGGMKVFAVNPADGKPTKGQCSVDALELDLLVSDGSAVRPTTAGYQAITPSESGGRKAYLYATRPMLDRQWRVSAGRGRGFDRHFPYKSFFWSHVGQVTIGDPLQPRTFAYKQTWIDYRTHNNRTPEELGGDLHFWDGVGIAGQGKDRPSEDKPSTWSVPVPHPTQVESLVLAGDVLFAAGPFDKYHRDKGAFLRAYNSADGKLLNELKLKAPPVADGMAAASGKLFVSLENGKVLCYGK